MSPRDDAEAQPGIPNATHAVVQRATKALRAGRHVIIAGDLLLDRRAIVADIVAELRAAGAEVVDTVANELPAEPIAPGAIVVVDATTMSPDLELRCTTLASQHRATVLLGTPSSDVVGSAASLSYQLRATNLIEIALAPLTAGEAHALVEQTAHELTLALAPVEANWMIAMRGASAPLLRAIIQDYAESVELSVAVFGRRTRVVANEALTEIPATLRPVAQLIASLPGINRRRLRQFIDRRSLDLLAECAIAQTTADTIVIVQAVALALRLTEPTELHRVAALIASDVISSLALGTQCDEAEVLLVSRLLREHPQAFAEVPHADRSRLLFVAMWLQRRSGVTDQAAFTARQLMAQPGWQNVSVLRSIARGQTEDLDALSTDLHSGAFPAEAYDVTVPWVQCLSLPLTRDTAATRWAVNFADDTGATATNATGTSNTALAALRTVLRAAQAVQEHDLEHARMLATEVLLPQGAHDATRLRALIILGACASLAADGSRVERLVERILDITLRASQPGLTYDLARRGLDDALLLCSLAVGSLGAQPSEPLIDAIDARTHTAALADDHPALIRMTLARLTIERDPQRAAGTLRFLGRLTQTDLSAWVVGGFRGEDAPRPMHLVSGTFMDHVISATRLMGTLTLRGPAGLQAYWQTYPAINTPFRAICDAYLALTVRGEEPSIDVAGIAELTLPAQSLLGALRDHVVGLVQNDPTTLMRALRAFVENHAWACARIANRDLATITADDPSWSKQVKASQRLLQAEMRSVTEAQVTLTPRERQITQLASQGLRNKQIAEKLFVSVRTVESHLYRALHKLSAVGGAAPDDTAPSRTAPQGD